MKPWDAYRLVNSRLEETDPKGMGNASYTWGVNICMLMKEFDATWAYIPCHFAIVHGQKEGA